MIVALLGSAGSRQAQSTCSETASVANEQRVSASCVGRQVGGKRLRGPGANSREPRCSWLAPVAADCICTGACRPARSSAGLFTWTKLVPKCLFTYIVFGLSSWSRARHLVPLGYSREPSRFIDTMSWRRKRYAPYRTIVRNQLSTVDLKDQCAFKRWLDTVKSTKNSQQTDLPSSQLAPRMSHINPNIQQLFVVIDTCSIVRWTHEFMDFVTNLKNLYKRDDCPIKFIISLTVLEELDKCNRPLKKRGQQQQQLGDQLDVKPSFLKERNDSEPPVEDLLRNNTPPRLFMRFIEEEMRTGQILIGELDPYKQIKLEACETIFEIVNKDDRILECCLRSWAFIRSKPLNQKTKLILVSEDNIFKAKASTFGVASFRWREFEAKYRNFGQRNCVPTPIFPPKSSHATNLAGPCQPSTSSPRLDPIMSLLQPTQQVIPTLKLGDQLKDSDNSRSVSCGSESSRRSSLLIRGIRNNGKKSSAQKELVRKVLEDGVAQQEKSDIRTSDEIVIVKEVININ